MCYTNAEEVSISMAQWNELFPDGFPVCYIDTDGPIDIKASLPNIEKGCVRDFRQWATTKNAERAARLASCRITGVFPLLNALKTTSSDGANVESE